MKTTEQHAVRTTMVSTEDTALAVTDTGGSGRPVLYLNGSYADQSHWRRVISDLGGDFRHITYDERARGKSDRSADYSFEACLRDIDAVLAATGAQRPILVGWSYGAMLAVHWAARNPDRTAGVVSVDGALPHDWLDDAARAQIRTLFRRLSPIFPVARRLGMAARMSAAQHAEINIEINELCAPAELDPVLDRLAVPTRYVLATGGNLGGDPKLMEQIRANLDPVLTRNPNIQLSAKVASNHSKILRNDHLAVAQAVRGLSVASTPVSQA
ncbi:pimeloyl-ACP methyl ester carboxylesterase [Kitasatospora gansuensis]|uniref:Pimeloyl-ACP methyl ester carboxylesterase n=1 Tax=Kitasatospora gansuensis TaxID=258050 RepID=A0A7W7WIN8_9ACTN|nr:alpha/beta hydrolase [Kitasatospora gansuensis]MBB4948388.1 pimeloyl-ACP methyl ester carboxylesterase [Kitasatospora gansuensis]